MTHIWRLPTFVLIGVLLFGSNVGFAADDPLPSWRDSEAKRRIIDFVARVTSPGSPDFVPVAERIATFDNDGTLWSEKPYYFQLMFAIDSVKAMAPQHPEWKTQEPFKYIIDNDLKGLFASGEKNLLQVMMLSHSGMTEREFRAFVKKWISTARHPRFDRAYPDLVYQPMLEVLAYFRDNDFKTFIVSGGGISFMRPWAPRAYGIPPEQIVGSSIKTKFEIRDGKPVILRLPEVFFIDDKAGKPVGIDRFIGRHPVAAFGNSDGDLEMLQWTAARSGASLKLIVHHTDAVREWAYDRNSLVGRLDKALDVARARNWIVVDMKRDWAVIFPFQKQ